MENKSNNLSLKVIQVIIGIGIWAIVLQNAGIIPTKQNVYVKGGYIDVDNTVDIYGSVSVDNEVDINISSVNGYQTESYREGHLGVTID
jgi:hypothetical protein